jgi:hypothetical protein
MKTRKTYNNIERILTETLNSLTKTKKENGLIKKFKNGLSLHRCKNCQAYHSNMGTHKCRGAQ